MVMPEKDGDHGYWKHVALINTPVRMKMDSGCNSLKPTKKILDMIYLARQ